MDRQAWLKERMTGIGGSDVAAVLGLSRYKTPIDIFNSKTGAAALDDEPSEPAYWGTVLEDVVAAEFSIRTGLKVQRVNSILRHPEHPWMMANIDRAVINPAIAGRVAVLKPEQREKSAGRLLSTDTLLECKTASAFSREWGREDDADHKVPLAYELQCQWYMAVTGASTCHLAVLIGGQNFRRFEIARDPALIDALIERMRAFWFDHVQAGIAPAPTNGAEALATWPADNGDAIEVDNDTAIALGELPRLEQEAKQLAEQIDAAKDRIRLRIGAHAALTLAGDVVATWKSQSATRIDSKALKTAHPDLYTQFSKTTDTRVLRFR